jgi:histidine ammonia-lyase
LEIEADSVTDNPLVDHRSGRVLSGGNFHGQVLSMAMDHAALALAEWGSISERRTYQLISGTRGLPPFLSGQSGLESGFMIPQYTAAALVSHNKQLATPCVVDSIPSSNGQEDHVSMGANAANRLATMLDNLFQILAVEWLTANRALSFRQGEPGFKLLQILEPYRSKVRMPDGDAYWSPLLAQTRVFMEQAQGLDS